MPRIVYIATASDFPKVLLGGQFAFMRSRGMDVVVVASPGPALTALESQEQVRTVGIPVEREIRPAKDLVSAFRLYRLLRELAPDIVNAGTPKAAMLGLLAARFARVSVRIYTLHGLRLETTRGLKRWVLKAAERLTSGCAQQVICVSQSLESEYLGQRLAAPGKTTVLGDGSANGVSLERFSRAAIGGDRGRALRLQLGIGMTDFVIGYLGRFTRDKGIVDLYEAFARIAADGANVRLLLVGRFEDGDPLPEEYVERIRRHPKIVTVDFVSDPAPYYGVIDLLALPSFREGFPTIVIEAAAAGVPSVGYRVTGLVDAIVDGHTGTLVAVGAREALAAVLRRYLEDEHLRRQHGEAALARARSLFANTTVWSNLLSEYRRLLSSSRAGRPLAGEGLDSDANPARVRDSH
jgi:glycosyltransferase involved in cell wall biosynthesis